MTLRSAASAAFLVVVLAVEGFSLDITGRVLADHSGEPLASARVRIVRQGQRLLAAERDTDRQGRFSAQGLPEGQYLLEVSKSNYASLTAAAEAGEVAVRLVKLGVISGRVLDGQGQAISGATVFPSLETPDGLAPEALATATTNAQGEYRLHGLLPGRYLLSVSLARLQSSGAGAMSYPSNANPEVLTISSGDENRNINFAFAVTSYHAVQGKVQLPEDGGVFAATLVSLDRPDLAVAMTKTEADGAFRFDRVPTGSYRLLISGPAIAYSNRGVLMGGASQYGATRIDVLGQDVTGVSVGVEPGRNLHFVLAADEPLPAGTCPAEAPLRLTPLDDRGSYLMPGARISFAESQLVEGLAPSRYRLTLSELGERCFVAENPVLDVENAKEGELIRILLAPAGRIAGRLVGLQNGAEYAVILTPAFATPLGSTPEGVQVAFADAAGRFFFDALPPGKYRIAAQAKGDPAARLVPADLSKMFEIDVAGGVATEVDLPARLN